MIGLEAVLRDRLFSPDEEHSLSVKTKKVTAESSSAVTLKICEAENYSALSGLITSSMKLPEFSRSAAAF